MARNETMNVDKITRALKRKYSEQNLKTMREKRRAFIAQGLRCDGKPRTRPWVLLPKNPALKHQERLRLRKLAMRRLRETFYAQGLRNDGKPYARSIENYGRVCEPKSGWGKITPFNYDA
jgi:hypothetical protein